MKNIKFLGFSWALLLSAFNSFSQTVMSSNLSATNTLLIGRYSISQVTVAATGAVTTVSFYDSSGNLYYTNPTTRYLTNYTTNNMEVVFTNSLGNLATSYYNGVFYYWVTNAAKSNDVPAFSAITVQANTPITLPVDWFTGQGLVVKVSAATATITIVYK